MERFGKLLFAGLERRFGTLLLGDVAQGGNNARLFVDHDQAAGDDAGQQFAFLVLQQHLKIVQALVADDLLVALLAF